MNIQLYFRNRNPFDQPEPVKFPLTALQRDFHHRRLKECRKEIAYEVRLYRAFGLMPTSNLREREAIKQQMRLNCQMVAYYRSEVVRIMGRLDYTEAQIIEELNALEALEATIQ